MYKKRLKQKAMLLVVLLGFFILLIMPRSIRESEEHRPEEAERLEIPKEEEHTFEPEEVWEMPGADAKIRVLILADDGGIYHREKELEREYPGALEYFEEEEGWVIVNEEIGRAHV